MGKLFKRFIKKLRVVMLVVVMLMTTIANASTVNAVGDSAIANITFASKIVKDVGSSNVQTSIDTGDSFFLAINYSVHSGGDNVRYRNCVITIQVPENVEFDGLAKIDGASNTFNKAEVDDPFNDGTQFITITSNETLESGNSGTMYLKMHFKNMETPDGSVAEFDNMVMTGNQIVGTELIPLKDIKIPSSSITATANQSWSIKKSVKKQNGANESIVTKDGKKFYKVNYQLTLIPGEDETANGNRYGRLNCEKFELTDTLPVGYPLNGGAKLLEINVGSKVLKEGSDYTVVKNNSENDDSIKNIKFNYVSTYNSKNETGTSYVPDGAPINTIYDIAVYYLYDAYEIPANQPFIQKVLDNKATLVYQPLAKGEKTVNSNAVVNLGWQDQSPKTYDFTVTKKVTIDTSASPSINHDETFILNKKYQKIYYRNGENPVTFGLYEDPDCTIVAKGYQGLTTVGDPVAIDDDGKVTFKGVVAGTYYLKEIMGPSLFINEGIKKVVVNKDGIIKVEGIKIENDNIDYLNTTDAKGYGYVAFWKRGSSATQEDAGWLNGVEFTLTNANDPTKTYTTTSNRQGLVLFSGIPAGEYIISENNSDGEFEQNDETWNITVEGNKVNYPSTMDKYKEGNIEYPYVLNKSNKGKFKLLKRSVFVDTDINLEGAEFKVYGPFAEKLSDEELTNFVPTLQQEQESFTINGNEESKALEAGYYVFVETKAPDGYTLNKDFQQLEVTKNHLASIIVFNIPQGKLQIEKYGVLSSQIRLPVPLANVQFGVYADSQATVPVLDDHKQPIIITSTIDASGNAASNVVSLDAGKYYLKELNTPAGYLPLENVIEVTVNVGHTSTAKIDNVVAQKGQLQLIKKDSKTSQPLKGAAFDIYLDNGTKVTSLTTNANGEANSEFLNSGRYYLIETKAPANYTPLTKKVYFEIKDNQITTLEKEIANDPLVKYQLKKVSAIDHNTILAGVVFNLYAQDPAIDDSATRYTTDQDGLITFINLVPGQTYYYQEYTTLNGYQLDSTVKSFVAPLVENTNDDLIQNDGPAIIENIPLGKFTVIKTRTKIDSSQTEALANITFSYYPKLSSDSSADKTIAQSNKTYLTLGTTNNKGKITSGFVDPGQYWVEEKASALYKPIEPKVVTVLAGKTSENDASVIFNNEFAKGLFKIEKISSLQQNGKNVPVVANFNIYKYEEGITDYSDKKVINSFKTNANGKHTSGYTLPGEYVIVEQSVVGNYILDQTPYRFTVEAGKTNTVYTGNNAIKNIPYSSLGLTKVEKWLTPENAEVTLPAPGFKFNVYKGQEVPALTPDAIEYKGKFYMATGEPVITLTSGHDEVTNSTLQPGFYLVKEELTKQQANDYQEVIPQVVELTAGNKTTVHFENISVKSKIKLTKVNAANHDQLLNDAVFEIYRLAKDDEKGEEITIDNQNYKVVYADLGYTIKSGTGIIVDKNGNEITQDGIGFSGLLEPNQTYFLKETQAPPGGWVASNIWTKVGPLQAGKLSEVTITNYLPVAVIGHKIDGLNAKVSGATFGLIENKEKAQALLAMTPDQIDTILSSDVATQKAYGILQTCITNQAGEIKFVDLDEKETYIIIELKAPDGFELDKNVHEVTIKYENDKYYFIEDGKKLNVVDYEFQRIWIKKQLIFAGEKSALNGINFVIYQAVEVEATTPDAIKLDDKYYILGKQVDSLVTGSDSGAGNGGCVSVGLPAGKYIVVEDVSRLPEHIGIKEPANPYHLVTLTHVDSANTRYNKVLYDNPIINETNYGKFYLNKVSNISEEMLLSASFKLQVLVDDEYIDYTNQNVTIQTDGKEIYKLPILLPAGNYRLIETAVESGYTLNSEPIYFTIQAGKITGMDSNGEIRHYDNVKDAIDNPIEVINYAKGQVSIVKLGTQIAYQGTTLVDNVKLNGIEFDIHKYKIENGKLLLNETNKVGSAISNNGVLIFRDLQGAIVTNTNWLDAGDYVIKETNVKSNVDAGYVADYLGKFTIVSNQLTTKVTPIDEDGKIIDEESTSIMNKSIFGKFQITKVDRYNHDKKLAGVTFEIYTKDHQGNYTLVDESAMTTNDDGVATSKLLAPGDYYVKETRSLSGYQLDSSYHGPYHVTSLTVNEANNNLIENVMKQKIIVEKVDSSSGDKITPEKMSGTTFKLYASDQVTPIQTAIYTEGEIVFTDLLPDTTYYLQEIVAPEGYELNDTLIPVKTGTTQEDSSSAVIVKKKVENDRLGSLKIQKLAKWSISGKASTLPLSGAEFTLYHQDGTVVSTKMSDSEGYLTFNSLAQGTYKLVETKAPEGFAENSTEYMIEIEKGQENSIYTGDQAIINDPNLGKFEFTKTKANGEIINEAHFKLVKIEAGNEVSISTAFDDFITDAKGYFSSSMLEPGKYRLFEIEAPEGYAKIEPITFEIRAKEIIRIKNSLENLVDDAQGSVKIIKYNDVGDYTSSDNQLLSGVHFGLYKQNGTLIEEKITDTRGEIIWKNIDPGQYYVQEIKTPANPEGYQYSKQQYSVTVKKGASNNIIYTPENIKDGIINESTMGKIVVKKFDQESREALAGAEFKVYKLGDETTALATLTTNDNGIGVSGLLPASPEGTTYLVKETKAPDGYILDEKLNDTIQTVKVYPVQDAQLIIDNKVHDNNNLLIYWNTSKESMLEFNTGIEKGITTLMLKEAKADTSLSKEAYSTLFAIRGFAKGDNKVKASELRVSDTDTIMQYYDTTQGKYVEDDKYLVDANPYVVDSVKIYQAYNPLKSIPVKAIVQYQSEHQGEWKNVPNGTFENINSLGYVAQEVKLDKLFNNEKAVHVRVVYTGILPGFVSEGFDLGVTCNQRKSDDQYHEITRIVNTANVEYDFNFNDELGKEVTQTYKAVSNEVEITFPTIEESLPTANIGVVASDPNGDNKLAYKPGDSVAFRVTTKNISENGTNFKNPIISLDLPIGVSLNHEYSNEIIDPFFIIQGTINEQGNVIGNTIDLSELIIDYTPVDDARVGDKLESTGQPTTKITFRFKDGRTIKPGEVIQISLIGTISPNETANTLWMPVYLNSEDKIVKSAENPFGNSFTVMSSSVSANPLVEDTILDKVVGAEVTGGTKYAAAFSDIIVNDNNSLSIFKQVKGEYDADYLDYNNIAQTSPNGAIDYNIQVTNGATSDRAINKIRVVDILPFYGDSLVSRDNSEGSDTVIARSTSLKRAPILNNVDTSNLPEGSTVEIYYCIDSYDIETKWDKWTIDERSKITKEDELPMLYQTMNNSAWDEANKTHTWLPSSQVAPSQLQYVSAIAVEITCDDRNLFKKGDDLNIHINMTAPLYGTQEVEEYEDKLIANSAMVAVGREYSDAAYILNSDRVENHEVKVKITMPKGSIGDYAFYDLDRDGMQSMQDVPVAGLPVKLHQFKTYYNDQGKLVSSETVISTKDNGNPVVTDENGYYQFTNLDCNVPFDQDNANSKDPNDFAGGAYYEYQVEFALPSDESTYTYVPTIRYAGNNAELDSNIGNDSENKEEYLKTEKIRLTATKEGNRYVGATNLTLDAGFAALGALGDYVWFDANRNGIQDLDEIGVNGVTVNLYKVTDDNKAGKKIATTKTSSLYGKDGYYIFKELEEGKYVVEFDISEVKPNNLEQFKNSSYCDKFDFTTAYAGVDQESDSNAVNKVSRYVMRSDLVELDYRGYDMSIDAGLTVHSALTGIAFEDRNYSDLQDLQDGEDSFDTYVPNTIVELYRINDEDGSREAAPLATTVVGDDGKYYFDYLVEGNYQVRFIFPDEFKIVNSDVGDDDTIDNDVGFELSENRQDGYTDIISIKQNSLVEHVDGGATKYSSIGDYVWFDANSDGIQDEDENGISEVPVYLQMRIGEEGVWEQIANDVTDQDGHYLFEGLKSSDYETGIEYRVIFDLPINTKLTLIKAGNDTALDSNALATYIPGAGFPTDVIHLCYNTVDLTWDAGIIESRGALGDYVWFDENRNGLQDEVGTGIGGISVVLEYNSSQDVSDESNWEVVGQTITNDAGYYIFTDLGPGMYRVRFQIDLPYYVTLSNIGNDSAIDSDGVTNFNDNWYYSQAFYLEEDGYDMSWDCGVYLPEEIVIKTPITSVRTGDNINISAFVTLGFISAVIYGGSKKKQKSVK